MDLERGDLATLMNLQPAHSLADFCSHVDHMDESMFTQCFARHESGVELLAAPTSYREFPRITPRGARRVLSMARNKYKYVIVDLDLRFRAEHQQVLFQSDVIALVLRLDVPSLTHARRILDYLADLQIDKLRIKIIVSRFTRSRDLRMRDVEEALHIPVIGVIPEDSSRVGRSVNRGQPVVLGWPRAEISHRFGELASLVNGQVD
jgi:pilus assembly protein CpaE